MEQQLKQFLESHTKERSSFGQFLAAGAKNGAKCGGGLSIPWTGILAATALDSEAVVTVSQFLAVAGGSSLGV